MSALWRMLMAVIGRKSVPPRDPAVEKAVKESRAKTSITYQLLGELRSSTERITRLERARLRYDERLHGTHRTG